MRTSGIFNTRDLWKRILRLIDLNHSYRKILILLIIITAILWYFGPPLTMWLFSPKKEPIEAYEFDCINERLASFSADAAEYNANILHNPPLETEHKYLPYIGNGYFGIPISSRSWIYIKHGRTLSLPIKWQPIIFNSIPADSIYQEATITHFTTGIVHKYQCLREGYYIAHQYYAHRSFNGLLVQDMKVFNPASFTREIPLKLSTSPNWSDSQTESIKIQLDGSTHEYELLSGFVLLPDSNKIIVISILYKVLPKTIQVKARSTSQLEFLTSIQYSDPVPTEQYHNQRETTKKKAIELMKRAIIRQQRGLKEEHVSLWQKYWYTSFRISDSKAQSAINGHKINSTMYYVLSQVPQGVPDLEKNLIKNDGCYRGHHTLDATKLWKDVFTISNINEVVEAWLVTLEKQGCHSLMAGGPSAVQQAFVLSLGGLRFSHQHLEFNIDPQYLHRDYFFRHISYGNVTHLNISVTVGEDNRAVLGVALDKSDSIFFGCDAGCLDAAVSLGEINTNFPVKLTKPLTPILYITSDLQHMQDLRNSLHVHEVDDAPAHDHHVMALHKHGHELGGLPTFFWVSIGFLIIVFHLFLFKLIYNESCGNQNRPRVRYSKL